MAHLGTQIITATGISLGGIRDRLFMSFATVLAVMMVVGAFLAFQAMGNGFRQTLEGSGSADTAVITRVASRSEINSVVSRDQLNLLASSPGIAVGRDGRPLYSAELYVIVDGIKRDTGLKANLPLRGLSPVGMEMRQNVEIVAGRMFEPGRNEIVVGEALLREFSGFELGTEVRFSKGVWTVVGVFSTGGSVFEAELWADARAVQTQFRRGSSFQSIRVHLEESGNVAPIKAFIEAEPRLTFDVETEKDYFAEQASGLDSLVTIGNVLASLMGIGALAGALNTMFASVGSRTRDIATLRAIGFSGMSAFAATLIESLLLSLIGGLLGVVAAYLFFDGISASTLGQSFTQVVFALSLSADEIISGVWIALIIGLIGGILPAWRAARLPIAAAFRL